LLLAAFLVSFQRVLDVPRSFDFRDDVAAHVVVVLLLLLIVDTMFVRRSIHLWYATRVDTPEMIQNITIATTTTVFLLLGRRRG
jgi:hypothetical protein